MEGESKSIVGEVFDVLAGMLSALWDALPKFLSFVLWVAAAFFILPCVFIAGTIYPVWVDWGEDF
jgi:hypothetical protein